MTSALTSSGKKSALKKESGLTVKDIVDQIEERKVECNLCPNVIVRQERDLELM